MLTAHVTQKKFGLSKYVGGAIAPMPHHPHAYGSVCVQSNIFVATVLHFSAFMVNVVIWYTMLPQGFHTFVHSLLCMCYHYVVCIDAVLLVNLRGFVNVDVPTFGSLVRTWVHVLT